MLLISEREPEGNWPARDPGSVLYLSRDDTRIILFGMLRTPLIYYLMLALTSPVYHHPNVLQGSTLTFLYIHLSRCRLGTFRPAKSGKMKFSTSDARLGR